MTKWHETRGTDSFSDTLQPCILCRNERVDVDELCQACIKEKTINAILNS